jgi:hypothetical protein
MRVQVALTDSVFMSLDARMDEMAAVKEEREATLGELREVLYSMWDSVGITDEDENRKFFERMLVSPARLHTHTHEKARYTDLRDAHADLPASAERAPKPCERCTFD